MVIGKLRFTLMAGLSLVLGLAVSASPSYGSPSVTAAVASPTHVALIVETAPGSVSTACVGWHSGMSGLNVLTAGATAEIGQRPPYVGFVLAVNGVGTDNPTLSTYWSYYRGNGTSPTTYSHSGGAYTQPAAGSVEEWVYVAGSTYAPAQLTYASICHDAATAAPTTQPRPTTTAPRHTTSPPATTPPRTTPPRTLPPRATSPRTTVPPAVSPTTSAPTSTTTATAVSPTPTVTSHPASSPVRSTAPSTGTPTSSAASSSSPSASLPSSSPSSTKVVAQLAASYSTGGGSPLGFIVAGLAVLVIGAFAGWRILTRRRT